MRIYIDESGSFKDVEQKHHSISCVTALIIPNVLEQDLLKAFEEWKSQPTLQSKKTKDGEVKGTSLNEQEISSLLQLLAHFDVIVETVCVDMGETSKDVVASYREKLANNFSSSETGRKINNQFNKNILMSLPVFPLFVQGYLTCQLIKKVLDVSIPYYVQRFPNELGSLEWIFDAKDTSVTEFERMLSVFVKPFAQWFYYNSGDKSSILAGEDYSTLAKYIISHEHLLEPLKSKVTGASAMVFNINGIMENISFEQSHKNLALQLVDIVANCIQRGLNDRLQFGGWRFLSSLIVLRNSEPSVLPVSFNSSQKEINISSSCAKFVNYFRACGKQMLVPQEIKGNVIASKKGYLNWSYLDAPKNGSKRTILEYY